MKVSAVIFCALVAFAAAQTTTTGAPDNRDLSGDAASGSPKGGKGGSDRTPKGSGSGKGPGGKGMNMGGSPGSGSGKGSGKKGGKGKKGAISQLLASSRETLPP